MKIMKIPRYARGPSKIYVLVIGRRWIELNPRWIGAPFRAARQLFPYFYAIGLRDCDSGGRVCAWYRDWGLNRWHLERRLERWNGAGDGEIYQEIGLRGFIQGWLEEREEDRRRAELLERSMS